MNSAISTKRAIQRNLDRGFKKVHAPLPNRSAGTNPPMVVVVMGPPKVGKTTLIKVGFLFFPKLQSLIKKYTKQTLTDVRGPITVVSGKNRRLTFIECPNDISSMIDLGKIADLVLLLVDGSFGFEMETFEFLNVLQTHGFPRVLGIVTHLDAFKESKLLRHTKKALKQRFWTEIYQGAKVFNIPGLSNGKYPKAEVTNICLYISRMKTRPLTWRNSHPFVLVDRLEDITDPKKIDEDPNCKREVSLCGP